MLTTLLYVFASAAFAILILRSKGKDPLSWGLLLLTLAHFLEGALR